MAEQEETVEAGSVLDPAHFQTVQLIILQRIYDVNLAFLATVNPEKAEELYSMHEQGLYVAPPPSIRLDDDDRSTSASTDD